MTLADLEGAVIETTVTYQQQARWKGQAISNQARSSRRIVLGPGDTGRTEWSITVIGPRGSHTSPTQSYPFTLGRPRETKSLGGGHFLWVFTDGTLTYLQTHQVGGYKATMTFARRAGGLTCRIDAPVAREVGVGNVRRESAFGGSYEIISSKQISSTCRVTKRESLLSASPKLAPA